MKPIYKRNIGPHGICHNRCQSEGRSGRYQQISKKTYLNKYCRDLNALAVQGKLNPLIGRRDELHVVVRTLLLRDKNNPVLVGEAGVGKTAIIEGLATRIADRNIHPELWGKKIYELSLISLISAQSIGMNLRKGS